MGNRILAVIVAAAITVSLASLIGFVIDYREKKRVYRLECSVSEDFPQIYDDYSDKKITLYAADKTENIDFAAVNNGEIPENALDLSEYLDDYPYISEAMTPLIREDIKNRYGSVCMIPYNINANDTLSCFWLRSDLVPKDKSIDGADISDYFKIIRGESGASFSVIYDRNSAECLYNQHNLSNSAEKLLFSYINDCYNNKMTSDTYFFGSLDDKCSSAAENDAAGLYCTAKNADMVERMSGGTLSYLPINVSVGGETVSASVYTDISRGYVIFSDSRYIKKSLAFFDKCLREDTRIFPKTSIRTLSCTTCFGIPENTIDDSKKELRFELIPQAVMSDKSGFDAVWEKIGG